MTIFRRLNNRVAVGVLSILIALSPSLVALNSVKADQPNPRLFAGDPERVSIFDVVLALAYTFPGISTPEQAVEFANVLLGRNVSLSSLSPVPTAGLIGGIARPADRVSINDVLVLLAQTFPGNSSPEAIAAFANALLGTNSFVAADVLAPSDLPSFTVTLPQTVSDSVLNIRFQIVPAPSGNESVVAGGVSFERVVVPGDGAFYANLSSASASFSRVTLPASVRAGAAVTVLSGSNAVLAQVTVGSNCGLSATVPPAGTGVAVNLNTAVSERPAIGLRF